MTSLLQSSLARALAAPPKLQKAKDQSTEDVHVKGEIEIHSLHLVIITFAFHVCRLGSGVLNIE